MSGGKPTIPSRSLLERAASLQDFTILTRTPGDARPQGMPISTPSRFAAVDIDGLRDAGYIIPGDAVDALTEEFRLVKRRLLRNASQPRDRLILVCSALPGEGKTFCAVNLALSMASERDSEVLLIDADFARPGVLATLGIQDGAGLMDALTDPAVDVERCIVRTDIPGLSVMPAGRAVRDDSEYLASSQAASLFARLLERNPARIVILDSPAALAASTASELAHHVGQALLVVRADRTREADVHEAIGLLRGCPNIQLLLNDASFNAARHRFGPRFTRALSDPGEYGRV